MENLKRVSPSETKDARGEYSGVANNAMGGIGSATVKMEKVEEYTTFLAEFAVQDSDIIIHFFLPYEAYTDTTKGKRVKAGYDKYWQNNFPITLSNVAMQHFDATYPRIFAEWVPEMQSWYMRCRGFGNRLDPESFTRKFFEVLDVALDPET